MPPVFFKHKFKCLYCSLHFICCSDHMKYQTEVRCPECGSTTIIGFGKETREGFIFQEVPGKVDELDIAT